MLRDQRSDGLSAAPPPLGKRRQRLVQRHRHGFEGVPSGFEQFDLPLSVQGGHANLLWCVST